MICLSNISENKFIGGIHMIIGVPKEIKNNEYRVAVTPSGVRQFVRHGHEVIIEKECWVGKQYHRQ